MKHPKPARLFLWSAGVLLLGSCFGVHHSPGDPSDPSRLTNISRVETAPGPRGNGSGYGSIRNLSVTQNEARPFDVDNSLSLLVAPSHGTIELLGDGRASYVPGPNYLGLDYFKFDKPGGDSEGASFFVTVSPCLKVNTARPLATQTHIVGVRFSSDPARITTVTVAKTPTPVRLILSSFSGIRWAIHLEEGASLGEVILTAAFRGQSTLTGVPDGVPVREENLGSYAIRWEPWANQDVSGYQTFMPAVRKLTGEIETSFQGCYESAEARVPATPYSLSRLCLNSTLTPSFYSYANQNCEKKCVYAGRSEDAFARFADHASGVQIGNDGLLVTATEDAQRADDTAARTDHFASCGKYYFELTVPSAAASAQWRFGVSYQGFALQTTNISIKTGVLQVKPNDTVAVGLDLDANRIYYSVNGALDPRKPRVKVHNLWTYTYDPVMFSLLPNLNGAASANFGGKPFRFAPPEGFNAGF